MVFRKLVAKDVALIVSFTALYVVLSFLPMFQIIGLFGKAITAATVVAPLIGIILGVYRGVISTFFGGVLALFVNFAFSYTSLLAGIITALCAGLLYANKRIACASIYLILLLFFGFFPSVGPFWLFPFMMWFQIVGFLILVSPLQSFASKSFKKHTNRNLLIAFFITSLTSTLAGQIAGSLVYELIVAEANSLKLTWIALAFQYPLERTLIAVIVMFTGAPLIKVLRTGNLVRDI
jgi:hypothetical protein